MRKGKKVSKVAEGWCSSCYEKNIMNSTEEYHRVNLYHDYGNNSDVKLKIYRAVVKGRVYNEQLVICPRCAQMSALVSLKLDVLLGKLIKGFK